MNDDVIQSGAPNPWRSRGAAAALVAGGLARWGRPGRAPWLPRPRTTAPVPTRPPRPSRRIRTTTPPVTSPRASGRDEELLTGTTADKVRKAALAKYPGATIQRIETDSDGVYEAHLVTADGQPVTVELDKDFTVTGEEAGGHGGHGGHRRTRRCGRRRRGRHGHDRYVRRLTVPMGPGRSRAGPIATSQFTGTAQESLGRLSAAQPRLRFMPTTRSRPPSPAPRPDGGPSRCSSSTTRTPSPSCCRWPCATRGGRCGSAATGTAAVRDGA